MIPGEGIDGTLDYQFYAPTCKARLYTPQGGSWDCISVQKPKKPGGDRYASSSQCIVAYEDFPHQNMEYENMVICILQLTQWN